MILFLNIQDRVCTDKQTLLIAPIYQSKKKKKQETPPYLWDQGNLSSVLHTDTLLRRYLPTYLEFLRGIQDGYSMN